MDVIKFSILLCENAFKDDKYLEENYKEKKLRIFNKKEAKGFAIEEENKLYICWRGLCELMDVFNNLKNCNKENLVLNNNLCGKVNGYIFRYYSLLRNATIDIVKDYLKKEGDKYIYFIGYSVGSSILLSALEIKLLLNENDNVHINTLTFGSPKLGDRYFMKFFNETVTNSLRIYDNDDIICKYPRETEYYHIEKGLKLKNKKERNIFQLFLESIKRICLKRYKIIDFKSYFCYNNKNDNMYIKIHTVENYKKKIANN